MYNKRKVLKYTILDERWVMETGEGKREKERKKVNGNPRIYIYIYIRNTTYLCICTAMSSFFIVAFNLFVFFCVIRTNRKYTTIPIITNAHAQEY